MLEEHGGVGGHLGEVAGPDAYVDEEPEDGRDVAVKVEGKHPGVKYCSPLLVIIRFLQRSPSVEF